MNSHLVTDSEIQHLPVHQRFLLYADAYLNASSALCVQIASEEISNTWPNASVTLLLAAHATELFLKGVILRRNPSAEIGNHSINDLGDKYRDAYPESEFKWHIPFETDFLGISDRDIERLQKSVPAPSVVFRFPVEKGGKEWKGAFGFEPHSFSRSLKRIEQDFARIKALIT